MIINNAFVMNANAVMIEALAFAIGMTTEQVIKAQRKSKLHAHVGTRFANGEYSAQFANDTLDSAMLNDVLLNDAVSAYEAQRFADDYDSAQAEYATRKAQADASAPHVDAGKRNNNISAKQWLIDLLSCVDANGMPVSYTLRELIALTGKTEVNIRTMLSDLRSAKYCGKYGVFNSKSTRINGEWRYAKA